MIIFDLSPPHMYDIPVSLVADAPQNQGRTVWAAVTWEWRQLERLQGQDSIIIICPGVGGTAAYSFWTSQGTVSGMVGPGTPAALVFKLNGKR